MLNIAHIHPMLVHFPIALLPTAIAVQLLALVKGQRLFEHKCLPAAGLAMIVLAAVAAVIGAVFGDIALDAAIESGVPMISLEEHEDLGQLSAMLLLSLSVVEAWFYRKHNTSLRTSWFMWGAGLMILLIVLTTAWLGGQLVYSMGVNVTPY